MLADEDSLDETDIPCSASKILEANGYRTVGSLRNATDEELLAIPGIGKTRIGQIRKALARKSRQILH